MIKLAIVSPCYNEEEVLEESTTRLTALFDDLVAKKKISADSFVLFVNDGSKDQECNDHRKRKSVPWKNDKPVRWSIFRDPWKYKGTGRSCSRSI